MPIKTKQEKHETLLQHISLLLDSDSLYEARGLIQTVYPGEIAHLLEAVEQENREKIWSLLPPSIKGQILVMLHVEVASKMIAVTDRKELVMAAESLESDDLVDLLHVLPETLVSKVLDSIDANEMKRLESALNYDDDCAGGLMTLDVLTIRPDVTHDTVLRYLRKKGEMPEATDSLMVVDRMGIFQGVLPLSTLLTKNTKTKVAKSMDKKVKAIPYQMAATDVAILFEQRDIVSAPVVSETGRLLGRITVDDIVDVIRDEADHSIMSRAGLDEEMDMFAPVLDSAQRRAVWLGINLFTAFLASWVIGWFETTLDKVVALAVLMPIVASMGGIAGSQTLTLVIRGLALRQIVDSNAAKLFRKELFVGVVNGLVWAIIVMTIAALWFNDAGIGVLLGAAMVINLIFAAIAGALIPIFLQKLGIDPALAGGVLLTTVTDVVGFIAFLGLATIFLL